jgi:hypothetical protein
VLTGGVQPYEGPVDQWEVVYAELLPDGSHTVTVVDLVESAGIPEGVSLAFDGSGEPGLAYGGGPEGGLQCGGSDLVLSRRSGGAFAPTTLDADGVVPGMTFPEDVQVCADYQNTCNLGDVVGPWPALAFEGQDPVVAYRDVHYGGLGQDSLKNADVQLYWQGQRVTADATYGGGESTRMTLGANGALAFAHINPWHLVHEVTGEFLDGIWVVRYDGAAWTRTRVVEGDTIGPQLGFQSSGPYLGLAWHDKGEDRLFFVETRDGATWLPKELVDRAGRTGLSPSLALAPDRTPYIAYHRCGTSGAAAADCLPSEDSIRLARRVGTRWESYEVRNEPGGQEGEYLSLVLDPAGNPVVAFQAVFVDPSNGGSVTRKLIVGRSQPR